MIFALPAGAVIWLSGNIRVADASIVEHLVRWLDPVGLMVGLNGVILLAYIVAIPANEIIVPTILMLTVMVTGATGVGQGAGVMFELDSNATVKTLLQNGGWTTLTGINLMLFSLLHNPCSTTIYTIYKETGSVRWTTIATLLPLILGFLVTFLVAAFGGLLAKCLLHDCAIMPALEATQNVPLSIASDGTIRVAETRVSLDSVLHHYDQGATAEEIAMRFPALRLADIHSCLGYYLNHQDELDDYVTQRRLAANELQRRITAEPAQLRGIRQMRERIQARMAERQWKAS